MNMTHTTRRTAQNLFRAPVAEKGTDAAKLQEFRMRSQMRTRELKLTERQDRQEKRASRPSMSHATFAPAHNVPTA